MNIAGPSPTLLPAPTTLQTAVVTVDLRARLRQRTAPAHEALERLPLMSALADGRLGESEYRDYLLRQHRLQSPLEAALGPWASRDWLERRLIKTAWLSADLRALGSRVSARRAALPPVGSYPQALGILYVLEGSTLGFQVVRKRLPADHPALTTAGRFLCGYGPETGARWRSFQDELAALPCADWPTAEAAALATFAAFQHHFSKSRS